MYMEILRWTRCIKIPQIRDFVVSHQLNRWLLACNGISRFRPVVAPILSPLWGLEILAELALDVGEPPREISHQLIWWFTAKSLLL
jgi:hypothetical protein